MRSKPIEATNFIEEIINNDILSGRNEASDCIQTRHPPEPSGYLHIGHARNIYINYGIAKKYGGVCNLRFDDTNPAKESQEFVDAIIRDTKWLGYEPKNIYFATDYFQKNYEYCVKLIEEGKAYVCDLSPDEVTEYRGTLTEPGKNSPYRNRSVSENLDLFERMKHGEFEAGTRCVRAKIDMASPNMNMRDPVIYRIQYGHHQRIGRTWNIYPTYDFSHPMDDAMEGVTHSMCGIDFEDHRPLYDWVIEQCGFTNKPRQIESSLLLLKGVILGKRNIKRLVENGVVTGWDDPRLFTLAALRRRGVTPEAILNFVQACSIGKANALTERSFFEHFVRDNLNEISKRVMAVLDPVALELTNWENEEDIVLDDYPQKEETTKRNLKFEKHLFVEREDFIAHHDPKFYRLQVGAEVRLKGAYIVKCTAFDTDEHGNVTKIYAEVDKKTKSGEGSEKKVKGTIHWLPQSESKQVEVHMFDNLIDEEFDGKIIETTDFDSKINTNSHTILTHALVESNVNFTMEERYQFLRKGYFCLDNVLSTNDKLVFNEVIDLKSSKHK